MNNVNKFYEKIFTWNNLIKFGYFDFQPGKNAKYQKSNDTDVMYGKTDFVNSDWFNFDKIVSNKKLMKYIQNYEYFDDNNFDKNNKNSRIFFWETSPIIFSIPKDQETRRVLKFPNFYSYCMLASIIIAYKKKIISHLIANEHSTSRFFNRQPFNFDSSKRMQSNKLIGYIHFYKTDFSNFYHTVYTHAIAWLTEKKETARYNRGDSLLGNLLDHAVEAMQNKESYGLPTGNLLTRIIVEYFMSFFDKEVKQKLGKNIDFTRYVDDIYFGYNERENLEKIKRVMYDTSKKYNFILNSEKTESIDFIDIKKSSRLLYFFDDASVEKIKAENFAKLYNSFFQSALNEIKNDEKGTKSLIFTSLRYFITRKGISTHRRKEMLRGLIYVNGRHQKPFIDDLLQLVLMDSRLILYFVQLIKAIEEEENKIGFFRVSGHFTREFNNKLFMKNLLRNLKYYLQNDDNQEAYAILSLFRLFDVHLSLKQVTDLLESTKIDDINCILLLDNYFSNMSLKEDISRLFSIFQTEFKEEYKKSKKKFPSGYFEDQHWFVKYELFYLYEHNRIIKKRIDHFYKVHKVSKKEQYMNYENFKKKTASLKDYSKKTKAFIKKNQVYTKTYKFSNGTKLINSFYIKLLDYNISFVNLKSAYNSQDV